MSWIVTFNRFESKWLYAGFIGLEISSSNFPSFDRNPNTGLLGRNSGRTAAARQSVFHDQDHPSRIVLPAIG